MTSVTHLAPFVKHVTPAIDQSGVTVGQVPVADGNRKARVRPSFFASVLFRNQLPRNDGVTRGGRLWIRIATGSIDLDVRQSGLQRTDPLVLPFGCSEV